VAGRRPGSTDTSRVGGQGRVGAVAESSCRVSGGLLPLGVGQAAGGSVSCVTVIRRAVRGVRKAAGRRGVRLDAGPSAAGSAAGSRTGPPMPDSVESHRDTSAGRIRSRAVGRRCDDMPEAVVVQGMADYLMPAVAELGRWTRAHLVELPGFAGSGEPTRSLDVPGYGAAVAE
jgi:hypothetical protein